MAIDAHRVVRAGKTYSIIDRAGQTVARLSMSRWKKSAAFALEDAGFVAYWKNNDAVLEREDGSIVVRLKNPSAWSPDLCFDYGEREYRFNNEPMRLTLRGKFYLHRDDGMCVAEFDPTSDYPKDMRVWFAWELPLEINVLLFWMAWMSWENPGMSPG